MAVKIKLQLLLATIVVGVAPLVQCQVFIGEAGSNPGILYGPIPVDSDNVFDTNFTFIPLASGDTPTYLDYDPQESYVYWAAFAGTIGRIKLNGTGRELVLQNINGNVGSFAVDVQNRKMYWTNYNDPQAINRANLNGTEQEQLYSYSSFAQPIGLIVDPTISALFWTNRGTGQVIRADLDGSNRTIILNYGPAEMYVTNCGTQGSFITFIAQAYENGRSFTKVGGVTSNGQLTRTYVDLDASLFVTSVFHKGSMIFWRTINSQVINSYDYVTPNSSVGDINSVNLTSGTTRNIVAESTFLAQNTTGSAGFLQCPSSVTKVVGDAEDESVVEWDAPTVTNTACYQVELLGSGTNGGMFPVGNTEISYVAKDHFFGNTAASCNFTVSVIRQSDDATPTETMTRRPGCGGDTSGAEGNPSPKYAIIFTALCLAMFSVMGRDVGYCTV